MDNIDIMNFFTATIMVALVVLTICMLVLYWNFPVERKIHPKAMTTCPDNWESTQDGKCIIPSADLEKANIGRLINKKIPLYEYAYMENGTRKVKHSITSKITKIDGNDVYANSRYVDNQGNGIYTYDIQGMVPPESYNPDNYDAPITIDFFSDDWHYFGGVNSRACQVKKWAKKNGISWDGLENYNQC